MKNSEIHKKARILSRATKNSSPSTLWKLLWKSNHFQNQVLSPRLVYYQTKKSQKLPNLLTQLGNLVSTRPPPTGDLVRYVLCMELGPIKRQWLRALYNTTQHACHVSTVQATPLPHPPVEFRKTIKNQNPSFYKFDPKTSKDEPSSHNQHDAPGSPYLGTRQSY